MNPKHKMVIDYMLAFQCSGVQAYMKYYPNAQYFSAANSISEILKKPEIIEYVEAEKQKMAQAIENARHDNLKWLIFARDADIIEAFNDNLEGFKTLEEIPPLLRLISNEIEVISIGEIGKKYRLKLPNKLACIKCINEMQGFYAPKEIKEEIKVTGIDKQIISIEELDAFLDKKNEE